MHDAGCFELLILTHNIMHRNYRTEQSRKFRTPNQDTKQKITLYPKDTEMKSRGNNQKKL